MRHDSWNLEGYERLRAAVVEQAVKDYRRALVGCTIIQMTEQHYKEKRNVNDFSVGI